MKLTPVLLALAATAFASQAATPSQLAQLAAAAPSANPKVIELALQAHECAVGTGVAPRASRLAVVDYSLPSTSKRLWVFDLKTSKLMYNEYVAHGQGTGDNMASRFSTATAATRPAWACSPPRRPTSAATATRCAWTAWRRAPTTTPARAPSSCT